MSCNLGAILKKKSFTGEDVGKVLILSLIDSYKQTLSGVRYPKPILPEAKMRQMIHSISGAENRTMYHRYVGLNDWLMQCQPVALNYKMQAMAAVERAASILRTARVAEQNDRYLESLPAIMTRKAYDQTRKRRAGELLSRREERSFTLFSLFGEALLYFLRLNEARKANPLKGLLKQYRAEPIQSRLVLDRVASGKAMKGEIFTPDLLQYYPALAGKPCANPVEQAEDFLREFPEAFKAVADAIDQTFLSGRRGIGQTPVCEWHAVTFSHRDLYDGNFFGVRESVEGHAAIFEGNRRAVSNGVAILSSESPAASRRKRASPEFRDMLSVALGILEPSDLQKRIAQLSQDRSLIEDGYYFAIGFDKAIEMIGEYVNLPDFDVFSINAAEIAEDINELNELSARLIGDVKAPGGNEQTKREKIQFLRAHFAPIRWEDIQTSRQGIETAQEMLCDNMRAFDIADGRFLAALAFRPQEDTQ